MMDKNEVKKFLYKENPKAVLKHNEGSHLYYETKIKDGVWAYHKIPLDETVNDEGESIFEDTMDAKYLIRWLVDGLKIQV